MSDLLPWRYGPWECLSCGMRWIGVWQLGSVFDCPYCDSADTVQGGE